MVIIIMLRTSPAVPSATERQARELIELAPPFESKPNMIASAPHGSEIYRHVHEVIDNIARRKETLSIL